MVMQHVLLYSNMDFNMKLIYCILHENSPKLVLFMSTVAEISKNSIVRESKYGRV